MGIGGGVGTGGGEGGSFIGGLVVGLTVSGGGRGVEVPSPAITGCCGEGIVSPTGDTGVVISNAMASHLTCGLPFVPGGHKQIGR